MPPSNVFPKLLNDVAMAIVDGRLPTGRRLTLADMEAEFGVSRTLARDVVKALESVGLLVAKRRARARFTQAATPGGKVVAGLLLWAVLFGSKFLVLELIAVVFRGYVSLGGFFAVTGLILALMLARAGVRLLLARGPAPEPETRGAP